MTTFKIQKVGCRAPQADGAPLERQLLERGCSAAPEGAVADFVVVNTCTVTAAADAQARDAIRKIHAQNPAARIIVTVCYDQRAPEDLAALPGVSWVVANSHKPQIPELIDSLPQSLLSPSVQHFFPVALLEAEPLSLSRAPAKILSGDIFEQTSLLAAPVLGGGGNHTPPPLQNQHARKSRCSYCAVPFVRGTGPCPPPPPPL